MKGSANPLNWETGFGDSNPPLSVLDTSGTGPKRTTPYSARVSTPSTQEQSIPLSRMEANDRGRRRTPTATEIATALLPDDPALAAVVDAWPKLPDAIKAGILAMVKAAGSRIEG
jgi:hypothetical protein